MDHREATIKMNDKWNDFKRRREAFLQFYFKVKRN